LALGPTSENGRTIEGGLVKRLLAGAGVLALGLALVTSNADAQSKWAIGAGAGGNLPIGNWNNTALSGWLAYVNGAYRFQGGTGVAAIRVDVSFSENKGKVVPPAPGAQPTGLTFPTTKQTLALAYLELHNPTAEKLDVYLGVGGGASRLTYQTVASGKSYDTTKGALGVLLGLGYPIFGKLDITGEGRFTTVFNGTFNPTTGKASNLNQLTATLGGRFRF
jgi:hypothetical protein